MDVRLTTLTTDQLETVYEEMRSCAVTFRMLGRYAHAAGCAAVASEASQILARREADHRGNIARQMSLIVPGAYDGPGAA